jgi:hypothetical protein
LLRSDAALLLLLLLGGSAAITTTLEWENLLLLLLLLLPLLLLHHHYHLLLLLLLLPCCLLLGITAVAHAITIVTVILISIIPVVSTKVLRTNLHTRDITILLQLQLLLRYLCCLHEWLRQRLLQQLLLRWEHSIAPHLLLWLMLQWLLLQWSLRTLLLLLLLQRRFLLPYGVHVHP